MRPGMIYDTILWCVHNGCKRTKADDEPWGEYPEHLELVEEYKVDKFCYAPYCDLHKDEHKNDPK